MYQSDAYTDKRLGHGKDDSVSDLKVDLIFLEDECHITVMDDGSAPLFNESVGDLISDIESAHMCASYS